MADSPAHKLGQIIGDVLEDALEPILRNFSEEYSLYLDKQGPRLARPGLKVSWVDLNGNTHDLDYVLERGGSEEKIGIPVAFIESAWRRYTKHSRNKAQEIQGAIVPLANKYSNSAPFIGVVLAGVFTAGALQQLKSLGFCVLYFDYAAILEAFSSVGIDVAFDEDTDVKMLNEKINKWENLKDEEKVKVSKFLIDHNAVDIEKFIDALKTAITRSIKSIRVLPLHGGASDHETLKNAIKFVNDYREEDASSKIVRYEVRIEYSNGDTIHNIFESKEAAREFLKSYRV